MTRRVTIGDLVRRKALHVGDGYRTKQSEYGTPGFRILRVADVLNGEVSLEGEDFVAARFADKIGAKLSQPADVLVTTKGTVGRVAQMPQTSETVVYSPQLCYFRVLDDEVLDPGYLKAWFHSTEFKSQASSHANNTDMAAYINLRDIRSLELSLPDRSDQRAIAEVLGALDDKITANRELSEGVDSLARLSSKQMLVNSDTAVAPLSSFAQFVNGRAFTKNASGTGRVVIRIAELNSGIGNSTVYNDIDVPDQHLARPGDILFAWSGSLTMHRWYRPEAVVNQHIFKVIPNEGNPPWLVWQLVAQKLTEFRAIAADKATTMGHIQRRHLDEPVTVPDHTSVAARHELMSGLWARALAAEQESLALAATRDALLPALMSGRLRVRDAERHVEAVV